MKAATDAIANDSAELIGLARALGEVRFARAIRNGSYERLFPGVAAKVSWWGGLTEDGRYLGRCVALAVSRPGVALTKLSAVEALGGQVLRVPKTVTVSAVPGRTASRSRLKEVKVGALPKHGALVKQRVTLGETATFGRPARADPAAMPGTLGTPGREPSVHGSYEVLCTSPACTMYDVAAAYKLRDALVAINSLLLAQAGGRVALRDRCGALPVGHPLGEKGKHASHLNAKAVADILRAKTFASFRAQAGHYRQHGFMFESSAGLMDECLALVWKNRGRRGVRKALLALLLASDKCESPAESLFCARAYEDRFEQPFLQVCFYDGKTGKTVYRTDGAWDLRGRAQSKRKPFARRVERGGTAPPGSRQALLYEFDGKAKYEDARILGGRSKGDVLEDQNRREAELRAMGYELVRFVWGDLVSHDGMMLKLARFGVPRLVRRPSKKE